MKTKQQSIGKEKAIALAKIEWWKSKSAREICQFQLFTKEMCVPFNVIHEALETVLGRPVYTHEFGLDFDGLVAEFLGDRRTPTFAEVLNLIPKEKLIVVEV